MPPAKLVPRSSLALVLAAAVATTLAAYATAAAPDAMTVNIVPLTVRTPHSGFNRMVVSVTLCGPGTGHCATIDNVMVDTGSTGLRIESSAIPADLVLPAFTATDGKPLAECLRFVHDEAWGPLYRADMRIGGLTAKNLPIQVIADDLRPRPAGCPVSIAKPTSNGTLGIGPHLLDCQGACMQNASRPGVFVKNTGSWQPLLGSVPIESRLPNPVALFAQHGNGIVLDLPASPAAGTSEIAGTLTFGVGTAANNRIPGAQILRIDANGRFTTRYGGVDYPESYIDSGTETYILADKGLPRCPGMTWAFCVSPSRKLETTMVGTDGRRVPVLVTIGDYRGALERRVGAWDGFAEVAERASRAFVWGAPFFLGRRVALVFDGRATGETAGVPGPFYALP